MKKPAANMALLFEHYFPSLTVDSPEFRGFSVAWEALAVESTRNTIALTVKQNLIEKLEIDVLDLKRKIKRMEAKEPA